MKKVGLVVIAILFLSSAFAQKKTKLNLTNALVVAQLDNPEDRYSLEINLTELLVSRGVKAEPSLNYMKFGEDSQVLGSDSIMNLMKQKGIGTYCLVSVRGYDKRFKKTKRRENLMVALSVGSLFDLYRQDIVSISFEFKFYREGQFVYTDIVKCGNVGDRATVLKRFRKKTGKRILKKWKKR
ncbi:MAG TPA: hypothetical protein EYG86_04660 [Crocinitomicaceae bacterium]|nr:hypothetical protein [Crocinitomicaceae bacterium]